MPSVTRRGFLKAVGAGAASAALTPTPQAAAGREPPSQPLNLLFIMTDQQRFDALSRAGNTVLRTPNLDRLAQEGVYFENAYTCCPVCCPARASMLTGCSLETTGVRNNNEGKEKNLAPDAPIFALKTFDEILIDRGYTGAYYGKWHAPEARAYKYGNRPIGMAGQASHPVLGLGLAAIYREYLDQHVPARPPREGELIERGTQRPYVPDPIDSRYGVREDGSPAGRRGEGQPAQVGEYGCIDIPPEHTRNHFDADRTIAALERLKDGPFTITCSFGPPHPPMVSTERYHSVYRAEEMPLPVSFGDAMEDSPYRRRAEAMTHYQNRDTIGYMIANYYALVREVDDQVGRILGTLQELGLDDRTLVIFTSDHGEMLGDHGMHGKGVFYEGSAHIPLLMRLPGVLPAGRVVSQPVSQRDLFATILDYLSAGAHRSEGRSLRRLTDGSGGGERRFAVCEWDQENVPNFMVRTRDWKLMFARTPDSQAVDALYNLRDDPNETTNLIGSNRNRMRHRRQAREMKDLLIAWLESVDSPYVEGVKARPVGA